MATNPFLLPAKTEDESSNPFLLPIPSAKPSEASPEQVAAARASAEKPWYASTGGQRAEQRDLSGTDLFTPVKEGIVGNSEFPDLPAIQETPEWEELGLGTRAASIFSTGDAVDKAFLEANPQFNPETDIAKDKNGNRLLMKDGKPYAYFEKSGVLNKTDMIEGAVNIVASTVPAVAVATKLANAARLARVVGVSGAELATQYAIEKNDLDEGVNKLNLTLAAAFPFAGEAISLARKGLTFTQQSFYIKKGRERLAELGYKPDEFNDKTLEVFGLKAEGKLKNDVTDDAIFTITDQNIPLTKGQATGDYRLQKKEAAVADSESEFMVKDRISGLYDDQARAVEELSRRNFDKAQSGRPEPDTGEEIISAVRAEERSVGSKASADQQRLTETAAAAGDVDAGSLKPFAARLSNVIKDRRVAIKRNKSGVPVSSKFMPKLLDDIDRLIAGGGDRVTKQAQPSRVIVPEKPSLEIRPEVPYKRAVKEGNVQRVIDNEMKYMRVKNKDAEYVRLRLDDMRDASPEVKRRLRFELENKGYNKSDIARAEKNIEAVRRPSPAEPKVPAVRSEYKPAIHSLPTPEEVLKGKNVRIEEFRNISKDINLNLRNAKGADRAALLELKSNFEKYMEEELPQAFRDNPNALAVIGDIKDANKSWRAYTEAFNKQGKKDRIGGIIESMTAKNKADRMSSEDVISTIIGANKLKLNADEMNRLITAAGKRGNATRELVVEAIERRVWGDFETSLASRTPVQSFKMLRQLMYGNRSRLGNILYPKGSKIRREREIILKTLDQLSRTTREKTKTAILNGFYARLGGDSLGGLRMVLGADQTIGKFVRRRLAKEAIDPLGKKGSAKGFLARDYYTAAAAAAWIANNEEDK